VVIEWGQKYNPQIVYKTCDVGGAPCQSWQLWTYTTKATTIFRKCVSSHVASCRQWQFTSKATTHSLSCQRGVVSHAAVLSHLVHNCSKRQNYNTLRFYCQFTRLCVSRIVAPCQSGNCVDSIPPKEATTQYTRPSTMFC
jgi:hypothetical protein